MKNVNFKVGNVDYEKTLEAQNAQGYRELTEEEFIQYLKDNPDY